MVYPLYVHIVGTQYAKNIAIIFGSKDINQVDKFLEKSTIIVIVTGETVYEISYEDAREHIKKAIEAENFESGDSYGNIVGGEFEKYKSQQEVGIYWPLYEIGMVDVWLHLERKYIFWYTIERIEINDIDEYCKKMFMGEDVVD